MDNTIGKQPQPIMPKLQKSIVKAAENLDTRPPAQGGLMTGQDAVTLSKRQEISATYSKTMSIEVGNAQEQYSLLRDLVTSMLKEQGVDFQVAAGEQEVDISTISQEEAVALIANDGYFGVNQTSDRIADLAISLAGDDPSRLDAIKEGVQRGFNEALKAFNGWLPDISYDTFDAVMTKLDSWAEAYTPEQIS